MNSFRVRELFKRELEIEKDITVECKLIELIDLLKKEFNIEANCDEFLISIEKRRVIDGYKKKSYITFNLTIKPSQQLLEKFAKDYPEMII